MARKKNDEESAAAAYEMQTGIIEETAADTEECQTPECEEKTGVFITLKKGSSYAFRDWIFVKNEPTPVDSEIAEKLMKTGFFERSGA